MAKPRLVQFASTEPPSCCETQIRGRKHKGIHIAISFSYRGDGEPVKSVTVSYLGGCKTLKLTPAQQDRSEKESVSLDLDFCLWCPAIEREPDGGGVARFLLTAKGDGESEDRWGVAIPAGVLANCCPVPPPPEHVVQPGTSKDIHEPVRPVPKPGR
jgi:hypothetical protein